MNVRYYGEKIDHDIKNPEFMVRVRNSEVNKKHI